MSHRILSLPSLLVLVVVTVLAGCKKQAGSGVTGKAGSMSRFALRGDTLYALGGSKLHVFDISDPAHPKRELRVRVGPDAETVFLHGDELYLGTRTGMYIYSVVNPRLPVKVGEQRHVYSCDPVVVKGRYAFVTLRSESFCRAGANELRVYDVVDPTRPKLLKVYPMTNPAGLGIEGSRLYVVDGAAGLKVYDASDPLRLRLRQVIAEVHGYDVIPNGDTLIVSATDGLYQFSSRDLPLRRLSRLPIGPQPGPNARPAPRPASPGVAPRPRSIPGQRAVPSRKSTSGSVTIGQ